MNALTLPMLLSPRVFSFISSDVRSVKEKFTSASATDIHPAYDFLSSRQFLRHWQNTARFLYIVTYATSSICLFFFLTFFSVASHRSSCVARGIYTYSTNNCHLVRAFSMRGMFRVKNVFAFLTMFHDFIFLEKRVPPLHRWTRKDRNWRQGLFLLVVTDVVVIFFFHVLFSIAIFWTTNILLFFFFLFFSFFTSILSCTESVYASIFLPRISLYLLLQVCRFLVNKCFRIIMFSYVLFHT